MIACCVFAFARCNFINKMDSDIARYIFSLWVMYDQEPLIVPEQSSGVYLGLSLCHTDIIRYLHKNTFLRFDCYISGANGLGRYLLVF